MQWYSSIMNNVKISYILIIGYAYYGEYPIHFAAATGNQEIYDYLIDHGANPNVQDTFGNTALHMVVICNQVVRLFYKKIEEKTQDTAVFFLFHHLCSQIHSSNNVAPSFLLLSLVPQKNQKKK